MKAYCLASSSAGNCFILEFEIDGVPTYLMVECGIPLKLIYKRASEQGIDVSKIRHCLVTHGHKDHCGAARDLEKRGFQIFATKPTLRLANVKGEELSELEPKNVTHGLSVLAFPVEHDIEGAVGFVIKTRNECVIFVIDHKRWTCNLSNFKPDYVFIECNYDHHIVYPQIYYLNKEINKAPMGTEYQEIKNRLSQLNRNVKSHCSLHGTIMGLDKLNLKNCKAIFLTHLSDRYANEYKMKNTVQEKTTVLTYVCKRDGGIK